MAAQELRWLTYLLTDLGEQPRSPPQRGQLRLAYVATRVNTADIFTKALPPGDHQRFSTLLGLLALLFLTGLVTTCSPPLCLWGVSTCTQLFASSHYFGSGERPSAVESGLVRAMGTGLVQWGAVGQNIAKARAVTAGAGVRRRAAAAADRASARHAKARFTAVTG
ncbi:unnamed protein product [Closterium sp. NIES-53]